MKIPTHLLKDWQAIIELDKIAIPNLPTVGPDSAYRQALVAVPYFNGQAKPKRAKKQGELF